MLKKTCIIITIIIGLLCVGCISQPVNKNKKTSNRISTIYLDRTGLILLKNYDGKVIKEFSKIENVYISFPTKTSVLFTYSGDRDIPSEYQLNNIYINIEEFALDFIGPLKRELDADYSPEDFTFSFDEKTKFSIVYDAKVFKQ